MSGSLSASHVRVRRAYDTPEKDEGERVLIDRLWPRGIKKEALALDQWEKDLAPSTSLRQWFGHEPARWTGFCERYTAELHAQPEALRALRAKARKGRFTLIYAAHAPLHNNAVALRQVLLSRSSPARRAPAGEAAG